MSHGSSKKRKPREITSFQVCLDHCYEVAHYFAALDCPVFPGEELSSLIVRGWALIRNLCEIVGFNPHELLDPELLQGEVRSLEDVRLPSGFEAALDLRVEAENKATIGTVRSKTRWARFLARIVIAQASYTAIVGTLARQDIAAKRSTKRTPPLADMSADATTVAGSSTGPSASKGQNDNASPRNGVPAGAAHATSNSSDKANAVVTVSGSVADQQATSFGNIPGLSEASAQITDVSQENVQTVHAALPCSPTPLMQPVEVEPSSTATVVPDDPVPQAVVESPLAPLTPAIMNKTLSGRIESVDRHATYGDIALTRSQDAPTTPDASAVLQTYISKAKTVEPAAFMLDPKERGYAMQPLPLTILRDLVHEVLGPVALETGSQIAPAAPRFCTPRVDRIDIAAILERQFKDDITEEMLDYFRDSSSHVDESIVVAFLRENALKEAYLIGNDRRSGFNPALLKRLLSPRATTGEIKLSTAARRLARTFANKSKINNWFRPRLLEGTYNRIELDRNLLAFFGPAGSGKSTTISYMKDLASKMLGITYYNSSNDDYHAAVNLSIYVFDASRTNLEARLKKLAEDPNRTKSYPTVVVIDECSFMRPEHLELLGFADQVLFFGDPRQMGSGNGGPIIRLFVEVAEGANRALVDVHRKIHPDIFSTLNFLGYDGSFRQVNPATATCAPYHVSVCRDDLLSRSVTLALTAAFHISEGRNTVLATQSLEVLDSIKLLISLDPSRYGPLLERLHITPLSNIQGLETDVLVLDCAEIDDYACDLESTIQFLFVVLGRSRKTISLVRPRAGSDLTDSVGSSR